MKKKQFNSTPGISYAVQSTEPIEIFEMMITDETVEYISTQTNLYFKQNIPGKIFKPNSRVMRHLINSDEELCISIDIRLYIAPLLYRAISISLLLSICAIHKAGYLRLLDSKGVYHKISWY